MTVETMLYRRYKQHFADCETVAGSYNKDSKTIDVLLPDGRLKPSQATRDALKAAGYRWHSVKKCWYAKRSEERLQALKKIEGAA